MQLEEAKVFKSICLFMGNAMMNNNNCQEYDSGMESLLLRYNKPFHFCSKGAHITFEFLLINF